MSGVEKEIFEYFWGLLSGIAIGLVIASWRLP
jgi:hypothetical protein